MSDTDVRHLSDYLELSSFPTFRDYLLAQYQKYRKAFAGWHNFYPLSFNDWSIVYADEYAWARTEWQEAEL